MNALLKLIVISCCAMFSVGCNVKISTNPPTPPAKGSVVEKSEKGFTTVSQGIDLNKYQLTTLPSGKQIKLIGVGVIQFAPGGAPPALALRYRTDIPLADLPALSVEAEEIWKDFQVEANKGGYTGALISAYETPNAGNSRSYNFTWSKDAQGVWQRPTPK